MRDLPPFTVDGHLPPGEYQMTLDDIRSSALVDPWSERNEWILRWRRSLINNLAIFVPHLWDEGITNIYIDGSFVTNKRMPGDIDVYFDCEELAWPGLYRRLIARNRYWLREAVVWDESHEVDKTAMWGEYHLDFYPNYGQSAGTDRWGNPLLPFPDFFRQTESGEAKGIVKLIKS